MVSTVFRFLCMGVVLLGAVSARAAVSVERSVGEARIAQVAAFPAADLILVDAGYESGLRQGMVCTVTRSGEALGELLLVDLRPRVASALILDLKSGRSLQPGDFVAVKTVSSRK